MYVYTVEVVVVKIEKERHGKQATVANVKMDSVFSSLFTVPHAFLLPLLWLFEHICIWKDGNMLILLLIMLIMVVVEAHGHFCWQALKNKVVSATSTAVVIYL